MSVLDAMPVFWGDSMLALWQCQTERRPGCRRLQHDQLATHSAGKISTDRQSQTDAGMLPRATCLNLYKRFEYRVDHRCRDARTSIGHIYIHALRSPLRAERDVASRWCKLDRIRQQVEDDLLDLVDIRSNRYVFICVCANECQSAAGDLIFHNLTRLLERVR